MHVGTNFFEFFRTKDKKLYALELNCRPPGGPSIDLMNHAHQIDLFKAYAVLVKENHFIYGNDCPYNSVYVSRRKGPEYLHSVILKAATLFKPNSFRSAGISRAS